MTKKISRNHQRLHRKRRIRRRVIGTSARPRLSVFRSLTGISAQVIDDTRGVTLAAAQLAELPAKERKNTVAGAMAVGKLIANKCGKKKIAAVVFDRSGYKYHGKVAAVAEGARAGGLTV